MLSAAFSQTLMPHKAKYDNADVVLRPMITNCWFDLPEEKEDEFRACLEKLPSKYTMEEFWKMAKEYKDYISNPPARYLLNFSTYPWDIDGQANLVYSKVEMELVAQ